MRFLNNRTATSLFAFVLVFALIFSAVVAPPVYAQDKLPKPTAHVNDTASVLDDTAKEQLENLLVNFQKRSGINFTIVTVRTTGGRDIFDFSRDLARDWDIRYRTSPGTSLLLVLSAEDKTFMTQFNKGVQPTISDGALGTMNDHMRGPINAGKVSAALLTGVRELVNGLADRQGMSRAALDQPAERKSNQPETTTTTTAVVTQPTRRVIETPATVTPSPEEKPAKENPTVERPKNNTATNNKSGNNSKSRKNDATVPQNTPADDEAEAETVELTLTKPASQRIELLKTFITDHPQSKSLPRANELIISARAAVADDQMKAGQIDSGVEQLLRLIADTPVDVSEKLYTGVISQIPLNLYYRGQAATALQAAKDIESKFGNDPKRLLPISAFYVGLERSDDALRTAEQAVKLGPDYAEAHHALALALHISLRLEDAAAEYKRTLELNGKTAGARRSLADLLRANGKFDEALAVYREQLSAQSSDKGARAGLVLTLLDMGKTDEAEPELTAALKDDPRNLALVSGAAYWFTAHGNSRRGLELARLAAEVEPRYTWTHIAMARALIAERNPQNAERSLRYARQYGNFPTLDYELANALASMGLYEEAGESLTHSFSIKDDVIQTKLANRIPASASNFIELLAPERRASIFMSTPADSDQNARILKALLAFTSALRPAEGAQTDEKAALAAAREFAAGSDEMNVYRKLYAASRLIKHGFGFEVAAELADAARDGVSMATFVPTVTIAVQADELRDIRIRALASGGTPDVPDAPRTVLANILRGRIEDLSGWALFNQDKTSEATERLRRAISVLPERTPAWVSATWHLGTVLQKGGQDDEALSFYIKSYRAAPPDSVRRSIIEELYKKTKGSLDGLDERIGRAPVVASASPNESAPTSGVLPPAVASPRPTPTPAPSETPASTEITNPQPAASPAVTPATEPTTAAPTSSPSPSAEKSPTPESSPDASPAATPSVTPDRNASPSPKAESERPNTSKPPADASPSPSPSPGDVTRPRRVKPPN